MSGPACTARALTLVASGGNLAMAVSYLLVALLATTATMFTSPLEQTNERVDVPAAHAVHVPCDHQVCGVVVARESEQALIVVHRRISGSDADGGQREAEPQREA